MFAKTQNKCYITGNGYIRFVTVFCNLGSLEEDLVSKSYSGINENMIILVIRNS